VAVKIISKLNIKENKVPELRQEAEILASLNHPNIIRFKHVKETQTRIFIVMELVRGGDLKTLMRKKRISE
jgi:serine/threonine protein kinase